MKMIDHRILKKTNPSGHSFPDSGIEEARSRSWKTRLLAPAAFIATANNPESPEIDDPTAIIVQRKIFSFLVHKRQKVYTVKRKQIKV